MRPYLDFYQFDMTNILWPIIFLFIFLRMLIFYYSRKSGVDHYYWLICVKNFKKQKKIPFKIKNKYLLEHDEQYYPPGFAIFLSIFPVRFLEKNGSYIIPLLIDIFCLFLTLGFLKDFLNYSDLLIVVCLYISAPILIVYNTHLTSRGLGNLFFICSMLGLISFINYNEFFIPLVVSSSIFFALMYLTHKMTTQYCLFLFLLLICSGLNYESKIFILLTIFLGGAISILIVGYDFSKMQLKTHLEIIAFWNRNWKNLGSHQFKDSKYYHQKNEIIGSKYHSLNLRGYINYLKIIFSYLPSLLLAPYSILFFNIPEWLKIWLISSMIISFGTMFISRLRCLGGGHLYLFNTVVPIALSWTFGSNSDEEKILFLFIILISFFITLIALYRRKIKKVDDVENMNLITYLNTYQKLNVGVFPTTFAERVAYETEHNVLWGAHGYSFLDVEPTWPVAKMTLTNMYQKYDLDMIVINLIWWKEVVNLEELNLKFNVLYKTNNWIIFKKEND